MKKSFLNLEEAAEMLNLSKSSLYKLCAVRKIPFYKPGRKNLFKLEELEQWVEDNRVKPISEINKEVKNQLNQAA